MLKHLVHSHPPKLHTFDDFYRTDSKPIKSSRSLAHDLASSSSASSSSASPSSPSSPIAYSFHSVFCDLKSTSTPDVVPEEDETEQEVEMKTQDNSAPSAPLTPVFYLEEDQQQQQQQHHHHHHPTLSSPHWTTLFLHRFRPTNHILTKQNSVNENQMHSTKIRKSDLVDSSNNIRQQPHRFLKRSETSNVASLTHVKKNNDDFPELSAPNVTSSSNPMFKKHLSFASLFHHFHHHHHHHHHHHNSPSSSASNKSKSTDTLCSAKTHSSGTDIGQNKSHKYKNKSMNKSEVHTPSSVIHPLSSPMDKSPSIPRLPKLVSLLQRNHHHHHHSAEHHKHRVGNLVARLHFRRNSPPMSNVGPKFKCPSSNELIQEITQAQEEIDDEDIRVRRPLKPVVMKRVHTWHHTFDLRPVDQCLEY